MLFLGIIFEHELSRDRYSERQEKRCVN